MEIIFSKNENLHSQQARSNKKKINAPNERGYTINENTVSTIMKTKSTIP